MRDTYLTVAGQSTARTKVKGSRFIAEALPVPTEDDVEGALAGIRQREQGATHHCSAYRLGLEGDRFRYDDDGEPSGTAGQPILRQIEGRDLTNTLVVVTRYFGGTKLGTGGLVRAYSDAAAAALGENRIVERVLRETVRLQFAYDDTSPVNQLLHRFDVEVSDRAYGADTVLEVDVRRSEVDAFLGAFSNALGGRGSAAPVKDT